MTSNSGSTFEPSCRNMVNMMMTVAMMRVMIYILWWSVCVSVTKNHHFPLPRWAPEARSEPKWAGFGLMIIMMMMRCIVSIPSPRERARPGKHLSRYFSLTNPFNAVSVFVALFFSYFSSFFVQISMFFLKSVHSSILLLVLTLAIQSNVPCNCFVCTVFAQDCSDISFCRDHSMPQLCL